MATSKLEGELGKRKKRRYPQVLPQKQAGVFSNVPGAQGLEDPLQIPRGGAYGLTNMAGGGMEIPAVWENARAQSQSQALQPMVAPPPTQAGGGMKEVLMNGPVNEVDPNFQFRDAWKNAVADTGPQYSRIYGPTDPLAGGTGESTWGTIPRAAANIIPGVAGQLMSAAGDIGRMAGSGAGSVLHQLTTPISQLEREKTQTGATGEAASQPAPKYHLPKPDQPTAGGAAPAPTVAAPGMPAAPAGTTPVAAPQAQAPASAPAGSLADLIARSKPAIRGIESGGNYQALGPVNPSGDRAYGIDQVMGRNIPSWTAEALGRSMTPEEFLNDPAAQEAVFEHKFGQYLQMGNPADAAARWFTGQPLAGREGVSDILGTTAGDYVSRYMNAMGLPGLPPKAESWQNAQPPMQPNPIDQPLPVAPDYSQVNNWLNQAAPQAPDQAAQRQRMINEIWSGVAQGNEGVDTRGAGGVGRLIAAWGKGAAGGKAFSDAANLREQEAYKESQRAYAGDRAQWAQTEANTTADWRNKVSGTQWANMTDDQRTDFLNQTSSFEVDQANRKGRFDAKLANRENLYKYREGLVGAGQGELKFMGNYVAEINPDGSLGRVHNMRDNSPESTKIRAAIAQGKHGEGMRLQQRYQEAAASGEDTLKKAIMEDVIASGAGQQVFADAYLDALQQVQSMAPKVAGYQEGKEGKANRDAMIANILWANIQLQGDENWIANAAAMQNPGALMLRLEGQ